VLSEGDDPELAQYSPEEMKAIVETAHGLGRKVAAHAPLPGDSGPRRSAVH
jgi:imidazolonepropionase-like amidohydrolase